MTLAAEALNADVNQGTCSFIQVTSRLAGFHFRAQSPFLPP